MTKRRQAGEATTVPRREAPAAKRGTVVKLALVVFGLATGVYLNTLNAEFTYDDGPVVKTNELITSLGNIPTIFRMNYWGLDERYPDKSLYRPVTISSYALNYAISGTDPALYHLVNVLLHATVSVILFLLVLQLCGDYRIGFVAGLWFGVHPIHTEAVAGIVGRAEVMACLGILGCCYSWEMARRAFAGQRPRAGWAWLAGSVAVFFGGMGSKETGVIAPAVILLTEAFLPDRRWLTRRARPAIVGFAAYVLAVIVFMSLRANAVLTKNMSAGFEGVSSPERISTALRVGLEYIGLLVFPARLSADYWISDVPIAKSPFELGVLGGLLAVIALVAFLAWGRQRSPIACWGIGLFGGALLLVSNVFFPIGVLKAERLLYTPSAGFITAAAALVALCWRSRRTAMAGWAIVWLVAALFGARTWARNYAWHDNLTLATESIKTSPTSMTFNTMLASEFRKSGDNAKARFHLQQVLIDLPADVKTLYNLGNIEQDEGNQEAAIGYYQKTLEANEFHEGALNNLGNAYLRLQRYDEAAALYHRLNRINADHPGPYINLMSIYLRTRDAKAGLAIADQAMQRCPNLADVYFNAADIYRLAGRATQADRLLAKAKAMSGQ